MKESSLDIVKMNSICGHHVVIEPYVPSNAKTARNYSPQITSSGEKYISNSRTKQALRSFEKTFFKKMLQVMCED